MCMYRDKLHMCDKIVLEVALIMTTRMVFEDWHLYHTFKQEYIMSNCLTKVHFLYVWTYIKFVVPRYACKSMLRNETQRNERKEEESKKCWWRKKRNSHFTLSLSRFGWNWSCWNGVLCGVWRFGVVLYLERWRASSVLVCILIFVTQLLCRVVSKTFYFCWPPFL